MKKILKILVCSLAVLSVAVVFGISAFFSLTKPVSKAENKETVRFVVPSGMTTRKAAEKLKQQGLIRSVNVFYTCCRLNLFKSEKNFSLKSGVYTLDNSMSAKEIYQVLNSGRQEYISVSIPEGLTKSQIGSILEENGICSKEDYVLACSDSSLLKEYSINAENFEGYLFPDTYYFAPMMQAKDVIRKQVDTFFQRVQTIPAVKNLSPEKLHEILILASIVEKEYQVPDEAPLIASVFTNRLNHKIGLYSCATIIYIITEIQGLPNPGRVTYDHIAIDSPYNTYKWAGLTPGPISNPGMIALKAAANPPKTNYYYFVLTDSEHGRHTFSTNFESHKAAEKK